MHPAEFSSAVSRFTEYDLAPAVPESFQRELSHTDLYFETTRGQSVFIEAKIDDFVSADQMERYRSALPDALPVLLVPNTDASDVRELSRAGSVVPAVAWSDLLESLASVNPLALQLARDVRAIAARPGSKARVRRLLEEVSDSPNEVEVSLSHTEARLPCLDVRVRDTWVFGQVESATSRQPLMEPRFQAKVGFMVGESDTADDRARNRMREALEEAWDAAEELEGNGQVELSRSGSASPQQALFGVDRPYKARGYRGSHVGVATVVTRDPAEARTWACLLAERFAPISRTIWGTAPAD